MPKQDYYQQGQLTDVAYLVLVSLATPCHGYLIMNKVEKMTEGKTNIGPASLYTTLKKLTQAGFIRLLDDANNKKIYCMTEEGYNTLKVETDKREHYTKIGRQALNICRVMVWEKVNSDMGLHTV